MNFPKMPPVNYIRQLHMFKEGVPRRLRFWIIVMFALFYQFVGGVYLASLSQQIGETGCLSEDITMGNYCSLIGLNIIFPMMFRWKFGLYTRQLFFISSCAIIGCSVLACYVTRPELIWLICLVAGYFKMMGMFGCMSSIQLNITPTRNFAVFFPVIYVLVCGAIQLSGIVTTYVTYFSNWRMMNLVIVVMMIVIDTITYFLMNHNHRSGPPIPLKGIDWTGQLLWIAVCVCATWIFTFGEHYDWWDSIEIWRATWLFILLLGVTLLHQGLKKEPYIPLKAFTYPRSWSLCLLLFGMAILQAGAHVLQPVYLAGVLRYDPINQVALNYPELFGVIMGAILAYFILVRWRWGVKKYLFLTFFMVTYYELSMYFIVDTATDTETMYFAAFALGVAEVMMETIATYFLSQNIPFVHFFMNITIAGFVRCGVGTAAGGAIVHRIFSHSMTRGYMVVSESIGYDNMTPEMVDYASLQSLLMALKESYGWLILVGIVMLLIILLSNYRSTITRFVPRMVTVSSWMIGRRAEDPSID
jgi:hypothetical protein